MWVQRGLDVTGSVGSVWCQYLKVLQIPAAGLEEEGGMVKKTEGHFQLHLENMLQFWSSKVCRGHIFCSSKTMAK